MKKYLLIAFVLLLAPQAHASTIKYSCSDFSTYGGSVTCSGNTASWLASSGGMKTPNDSSGFYVNGQTYYFVTNSTVTSGGADVYITGDLNANSHTIASSGGNFTITAPSNGYYQIEIDGTVFTGDITNNTEVVCVSDTSYADCSNAPPPPPSGGSMTPALVGTAWVSGATDFGVKGLIILASIIGIMVALLLFRWGWKWLLRSSGTHTETYFSKGNHGTYMPLGGRFFKGGKDKQTYL